MGAPCLYTADNCGVYHGTHADSINEGIELQKGDEMTATQSMKGKSKSFKMLARITIVFHVLVFAMLKFFNISVEEETPVDEIGEAGNIALGGYYLFTLLTLIFGLILLYKMWRQIPGREAPTTPGKAVGFLLIPFFNFYWFFIALGELAESQHKCLLKYDPGRDDHAGIVKGVCVLYVLFILAYIWMAWELPLPGIIDTIITWGYFVGRWTLIEKLSRAASALAEYEADASNETPTINVD